MKTPKYPEVLSINQSDKFRHFATFYDYIKAKSYAKKTKGQFYTQVDSGKTVAYVKGFAYVNRTGLWIVVRTNNKKNPTAKIKYTKSVPFSWQF